MWLGSNPVHLEETVFRSFLSTNFYNEPSHLIVKRMKHERLTFGSLRWYNGEISLSWHVFSCYNTVTYRNLAFSYMNTSLKFVDAQAMKDNVGEVGDNTRSHWRNEAVSGATSVLPQCCAQVRLPSARSKIRQSIRDSWNTLRTRLSGRSQDPQSQSWTKLDRVSCILPSSQRKKDVQWHIL